MLYELRLAWNLCTDSGFKRNGLGLENFLYFLSHQHSELENVVEWQVESMICWTVFDSVFFKLKFKLLENFFRHSHWTFTQLEVQLLLSISPQIQFLPQMFLLILYFLPSFLLFCHSPSTQTANELLTKAELIKADCSLSVSITQLTLPSHLPLTPALHLPLQRVAGRDQTLLFCYKLKSNT